MSTIDVAVHPLDTRTAPISVTSPEFTADIAIVGLGYVGLPTALAYHRAGRRVIGFDISERRLDAIRSSDVDLIPDDFVRLDAALADPEFRLMTDTAALNQAAAVIVCVPTPVDTHLVPDLSLLRAACATVVESTVPGQTILLTSTTYVGCTQELLVEPLRRRGLIAGYDIHVAFSPERIDPGTTGIQTEQVPRVVSGATESCTEAAAQVLAGYVEHVHRVPSLAAAEMTKLLENTFRAVNIALINEFADICNTLGLAVESVIDAAATKPYGFMPFRPGPGVGGHCIPCDPHYLLWQLRAEHVDAPIIATAMGQIAARPGHVVDRIREELSTRGVGLPGTRIVVSGVAYKPDVADLRESPALEIIERLRDHGADVSFTDPHVAAIRLADGSTLARTTDPATFHPIVVLLHTAHTGTDLSWIGNDAMVIDATYRAQDLANRVAL